MTTAVEFDPLSPENILDPYPLYARLREAAPVYWDESLQAWLITRHRDCVTVLRDTDKFAADHRRAGHPVPEEELTIQTLDPPDHAYVRNLLSSAYRAQDLEAIRTRARHHAEDLIARLAANGEGEFMADFAAPFALAAICDLLGVEQPDIKELSRIADIKMQGMDAGLRPERGEPVAKARAELSIIVDSWFDPPPETGMLGALWAQLSWGKISNAALINNVHVMFNAGYQSPFSAIGNAVLSLLRCGGRLTDLLDLDNLNLAVEELFRYDGIAQIMNRVCVEDVELGEERIRRGEHVLLLLGAANRDPEQFFEPDTLVLRRSPNRHLAFGWGGHTCLGSSLAREMMKITLSTLHDRAPEMRLRAAPVYKAQAVMRCPDRIFVSI